MNKAKIIGTGMYVPPKILSNDFFEKVGSNDAWIQKNLGIKKRHIAEDETSVDLAYNASMQALGNAGLDAADLDLIIVATSTPERLAPSSACMIQEKLGASKAFCFDLSAVCSGALFAISTGVQYIQSGMCRNVLVVGADVFSKVTDWERRDSVFFGDGAGAVILSKTDEDRGFLDFTLHSDGSGKDAFFIPNYFGEDHKPSYFHMDGKVIYDSASKVLPEAVMEVLNRQNISVQEIKCIIPHQPSINILKNMAKSLGIDFGKVKTNMDQYANTSGGTIPIMLHETWVSENFEKGDYIVFAAVGSGLTWGAALYKV